jgi:hypothetical protein
LSNLLSLVEYSTAVRATSVVCLPNILYPTISVSCILCLSCRLCRGANHTPLLSSLVALLSITNRTTSLSFLVKLLDIFIVVVPFCERRNGSNQNSNRTHRRDSSYSRRYLLLSYPRILFALLSRISSSSACHKRRWLESKCVTVGSILECASRGIVPCRVKLLAGRVACCLELRLIK